MVDGGTKGEGHCVGEEERQKVIALNLKWGNGCVSMRIHATRKVR